MNSVCHLDGWHTLSGFFSFFFLNVVSKLNERYLCWRCVLQIILGARARDARERLSRDNRELKGARSRYFRQFQHWSNGHRINCNIKITVQDNRRTQTKHRKAKKGHGWTKLERIEMDCIWVNLKNGGPLFFKFMSVYIKISFTQRKNHCHLLCGLDFANERLLLCQFDV